MIMQQGGGFPLLHSGVFGGVRVVCKGASGPFGPLTLILDQFTDTNGVALASHTIAPTNTPATSWTVVTGGFDIQSNQCNIASRTGGQAIATCNSGVSDGTLSLRSTTSAAANLDNQDLLFRYQDSTHYWLQQLSGTSSQHQIYENNGGFTLRASTAKVFANNTTYAMQTVLSGTSIACTVDGGSSISFVSSLFQTQTIHGVRDGGTMPVRYDDFQVVI